jgi:hypothetical protein
MLFDGRQRDTGAGLKTVKERENGVGEMGVAVWDGTSGYDAGGVLLHMCHLWTGADLLLVLHINSLCFLRKHHNLRLQHMSAHSVLNLWS